MPGKDRIGGRLLLVLAAILALTFVYSISGVVRDRAPSGRTSARADERPSVSVRAEEATIGEQIVARIVVAETPIIQYLVDAGGDTAYRRAQLAVALIRDALDRGVAPEDFHAGRDGGRDAVLAGADTILVVTSKDAEFNGSETDELAKEWAQNTREVLGIALGAPSQPELDIRADRTRVDGEWVGDVLINDVVVVRMLRGWGQEDAYDAAREVAQRIDRAVQDGYGPTSFHPGANQGSPAVLAGERLIVPVDNYHAVANHSTRDGLAERWAENISAALADAGVVSRRPGADAVHEDSWYEEHYTDKWVPILSVPDGIRIGAARVNGPVDDVKRTKAVAQIETPWQDTLEIDIYIPISTSDPGKFLSRVQGVGVTALADFDLTSDGRPRDVHRSRSVFDRPSRDKYRRHDRDDDPFRGPWR